MDVQERFGAVGKGALGCLSGSGADLGVTLIVLSKKGRQVRCGVKSADAVGTYVDVEGRGHPDRG